MKFQKRLLASVAVVALVAGVSACGGDDDEPASEATDAPTEATDAPTEATDAPTEATDPPSEATDAPTEATDPPTEATDAPAETSDLSIVFLPKNLGNAYFDTSNAGGARAIDEFGGEYQEVGPDAAAPDAQVPFINTATQQGIDALVVSANDPNAICSALDQAREAGIAVVTYDSDTDPACRDLFINQATAEGIARIQVDLIAEQIGDAGEIAVLSASANATNQNAWIEMMEAELAANHPDIELVDIVYGDDDDQTSFDQTAALLQTHPDLAGIISPTTVGVSAAARYLSTSEAKGEVALTGLGTPNQMREYVEDGTVEAFALWNPADLGYLAAYAAKALAEGTITGAEGDTFTAGELGEYTVGADATVLLGDPFVFNADNIGDFNF
jgi:rhamnose transport system substrate-binding protein